MPNLFDSGEYPELEPDTLQAGDRWVWKRTDLTDYPPASYALSYAARRNGTGFDLIAITANESGADYLVEVASATTAAYVPGTYSWVAYITRSSDSEKFTLQRGTWEVRPNVAADAAGTDPQSHAQKVLAAVESVLEGTASHEAASYSIAGRSLSRRTPDELISLRNHYRHLVAQERNNEAVRAGRRSHGNLQARFRG